MYPAIPIVPQRFWIVVGHLKEILLEKVYLVHHFLLNFVVDFHELYLGFDFLSMEMRQHEEFILEFLNLEGLHLVEHLLDRFEAQILQHVRYPFEVLFDLLLVRLV